MVCVTRRGIGGGFSVGVDTMATLIVLVILQVAFVVYFTFYRTVDSHPPAGSTVETVLFVMCLLFLTTTLLLIAL